MPFLIDLDGKSIDLSRLSSDDYRKIESKSLVIRHKIASKMLGSLEQSELFIIIKHLSDLCYQEHKVFYIRDSSTNFLADVIRNYVDLYDGERLVKEYERSKKEGLRTFRFSRESTDLLVLLQNLNVEQDQNEPDLKHTEALPMNIGNKIFQGIILASLPVTDSSYGMIREIGTDRELLETMLANNQNIHQAHVLTTDKRDAVELRRLLYKANLEGIPDLDKPYSLTSYEHAVAKLLQLVEKNARFPQDTIDLVNKLILKVNALKREGKEGEPVLVDELRDTHRFMTGEISNTAYKLGAKKLQSSSSPGLKTVAGIMLTILASVLAAAAAFTAVTGVGLLASIPLAATSTASYAAAIGFFVSEKRLSEDLSDIITQVADTTVLSNQQR